MKPYTIPKERPRAKIATQKQLSCFCERYNLDADEISELIGSTYLKKLKSLPSWVNSIENVIKFRFKTLPENGHTSNTNIANFVKWIIDNDKSEVFMCRTPEELQSLMDFWEVLPVIVKTLQATQEVYLSKFPQINDSVFPLFKEIYYESSELWKKEEITAAMVLSPAINEYSEVPYSIHCYTQTDGDILLTTQKRQWLGDKYDNEIQKDAPQGNAQDSQSGCITGIIIAIIILVIITMIIG